MRQKIQKKWQCSKCDEVHDDELDAEECCRPEAYEVFACPLCDDIHDTEALALQCCDCDEQGDDYHVAPDVLEHFGQQRLAL